jgi:hypothetical protein
MISADALTAATLLTVRAPEDVFPNDRGAATALFKKLAFRFHPDQPGGTAAGFAKLHELYKLAVAKIDAGTWAEPGVITLRDKASKYRFRFVHDHAFDLGHLYVGRSHSAWTIASAADVDLQQNAVRAIGAYKFASDRMSAEVSRYLPALTKDVRGADAALVLTKPEGAVWLPDLVAHMGGTIPPKHVAWIVSRLLNFCCWLEWSRVMHGGITVENLFVTPDDHSVFIGGGWWYSAPLGSRLVALPAVAVKGLSPSLVKAKHADPRIDLDMVRLCAGRLLGSLGKLSTTDLPAPFRQWLALPSAGSAVKDYAAWPHILERSFGPRRFLKLPILFSDIYEKD